MNNYSNRSKVVGRIETIDDVFEMYGLSQSTINGVDEVKYKEILKVWSYELTKEYEKQCILEEEVDDYETEEYDSEYEKIEQRIGLIQDLIITSSVETLNSIFHQMNSIFHVSMYDLNVFGKALSSSDEKSKRSVIERVCGKLSSDDAYNWMQTLFAAVYTSDMMQELM